MTSSTIWSVRSSTYSLDAPVLMAFSSRPSSSAPLSHVAGDGDDLGVVVVLLQPGDDDGRIQTAGIGQHYFLISLMIFFLPILWFGPSEGPSFVLAIVYHRENKNARLNWYNYSVFSLFFQCITYKNEYFLFYSSVYFHCLELLFIISHFKIIDKQ